MQSGPVRYVNTIASTSEAADMSAGASIATWPSASLAVGFVKFPPEEMIEGVAYEVSWYAAIDTAVYNLTKTAASDGNTPRTQSSRSRLCPLVYRDTRRRCAF